MQVITFTKLVCCLLVSVPCLLSGTSLFELLCEFRGSMTHRPGEGTFQPVAMTLMTGGGSSSELCDAFQALALDYGYEVKVMSGRIGMSPLQLSEWLGDSSCLTVPGCGLGRDGRWLVPFSWLRFRAGYGWECMGLDSCGHRWLDVFPGLVGGEHLVGRRQCVSPAELGELCDQLETVRLSPGGDRLWGTMECHGSICSMVTDAYERQLGGEKSGCSVASVQGVSGYRSTRVQSLRPVSIDSAAELPCPAKHWVSVHVSSADGVLLRCELPTNELDSGMLELGWGDSDILCKLEGGFSAERVLGKRQGCWVSGAGQRLAGLTGIYGDEVTIVFTFTLDGKPVSRLVDTCVVGEHVVYAFSRGGYVYAGDTCDCDSSCLHRLTGGLREHQECFLGICRTILGCENRIGMSRVGLRPYGTERLGSLYQRNGFCLVACSREALAEDDDLKLLGDLGSALVASSYLRKLGMAEVRTALEQWETALCVGDLHYAEELGVRYVHGGEVPCLLTHAEGGQGYGGSWLCEGLGWLDTEVVSLFLEDWHVTPGARADDMEGWCVLVNLLGHMRETMAVRGLERIAGELAMLSAFAGAHSRGVSLGVLTSIACQLQHDESTGNKGCHLAFAAERVGEWSLCIRNSEGDLVYVQEGSEDETEIWWNGLDATGNPCMDGDYVVQLDLKNEHGIARYTRELKWDVTAPELRLLCRVVESGPGKQVECDYSVMDRNEAQGMITITSVTGTETYLSESLTSLCGTCAWAVSEPAPRACQVELRAWDSWGNERVIAQQVQFDKSPGGDDVWKPEGKLDASWDDSLSGHISFPLTGTVISDGVVEVLGELGIPPGSTGRYQLRLRDGQGHLLACDHEGEDDDGWRLRYFKPSMPEETLENTYPWGESAQPGDILGRLDMSGLANGVYELELIVRYGQTIHRDVQSFVLESDLKLGILEFNEDDGTVVVGGLRIPLYRRYSSHGSRGDLGYGWRTGFGEVQVELCEERCLCENLWGEQVSVRFGGKRDLTMDLPDGTRKTFCFTLSPVGGWSYAYRGSWRTGDDDGWQLHPTVSDEVTALPGLVPHWRASGPGVPLEMYDFPGFVLMGKDGRRYEFEREYLGEYEGVAEDDLGGLLDCWGAFQLTRVTLDHGRELRLSPAGLSLRCSGGTEEELARIVRGPHGLIESIHYHDDEGTELFYRYDSVGNLLEVWKRKREGRKSLIRRYAYEHRQYPHLLTSIANGQGKLLGTFTYDEHGSLVGVGNGIGGVLSAERDVFQGLEIRRDENGFETVVSFDSAGRVKSEVHADGGVVSYEHDDRGNVLSRTDALGRTSTWSYDADGRVTEHCSPGGGVTSYEYDGASCSMTDPLGRRTTRTGNLTEGDVEYTLPSGGGLGLHRDRDGRLVAAHIRSREDVTLRFRHPSAGRVIISDDLGEELEVCEDEIDGLKRYTSRWVDPISGESHEFFQEQLLDSGGRVLYCADWLGNSLDIDRDSSGRVLRESTGDGSWRQYRYDSGGRLCEELDSTGLVRRMVYGTSGLLLLEAGPERFPRHDLESGEGLTFARGNVLEHDHCGRVIGRQQRGKVRIGMRSLGGGQVECVVEDWGAVISVEETKYDLAGQVVKTRLPDGSETHWGYDSDGRVVWQENGSGNRTTWSRDQVGRIVGVTDPLGGETSMTYGESGYLTERRDPDGRVSRWERGPWGDVLMHRRSGEADLRFQRREDGRVTSVSQGSMTLKVGWNALNGLETVTDGMGRTVRFERDGLNRLCREITAEGRERSWGYDERFGAPAWMEDGAGRRQEIKRGRDGTVETVNWFLDGKRTCEVIHSSGDRREYRFSDGRVRREGWTRDDMGRKKSYMLDGKSIMDYSYDSIGRLVAWETALTRCECLYDRDGKPSDVRFSRCGSVTPADCLVLKREWDPLGRCVAETVGEDWRETDYDAMGRITGVRQGSGDIVLYDGRYGFDVAGRRTSLQEVINVQGQLLRRHHVWGYDELGRLTEEELSCPDKPEHCFSWGCRYDLAGNMVEEWRVVPQGRWEIRHAYDRDNCLVSSDYKGLGGSYRIVHEWDESGALVGEVCVGTETWERRYAWDFGGRLSKVEHLGSSEVTVEFEYDARGLLRGYTRSRPSAGSGGIRRYVLTHSEVGSPGLPSVLDVAVQGGDSSEQLTCVRGRYPLRLQGAHSSGYIYNGHGGLVMRDGVVVLCDSWGLPLYEPCWDGPGCFGEWQESSSGLLYMRGRFYSPRLRRFISPDPLGGTIEIPQSFHRYAYCLNDPLNRMDPTGCFSMLSMLSSLGTGLMGMSMGTCFTALRFLGDTLLMEEMFSQLSAHRMTSDAATIWVHGMSWHERGWSHDMEAGLRRYGVCNQDYFEFRWSGYSVLSMNYWYPLRSTHVMGVLSLAGVLLDFQLKGYDSLNLISHSWGTVLSRDILLLLFHLDVDLWVTMGSPLGMQPAFPCVQHWLNVFNLYDPVVHGAPLLFGMMYNLTPVPLYQQRTGVEQLNINQFADSHTLYWTNLTVLNRISQLLRSQ